MDAALRLAHMLESKDNLAELKALFDTIDKDGDGRVTSKEWGSAVSKNQDIMRKYFGGKSLKQIGQAYRRLDADGSDDLTWDEFVAGSQRLIATDPS
jgi:Ca2+-binding EF-hand superfamily protein